MPTNLTFTTDSNSLIWNSLNCTPPVPPVQTGLKGILLNTPMYLNLDSPIRFIRKQTNVAKIVFYRDLDLQNFNDPIMITQIELFPTVQGETEKYSILFSGNDIGLEDIQFLNTWLFPLLPIYKLHIKREHGHSILRINDPHNTLWLPRRRVLLSTRLQNILNHNIPETPYNKRPTIVCLPTIQQHKPHPLALRKIEVHEPSVEGQWASAGKDGQFHSHEIACGIQL
jgi:hypothetical protein